MSFVTPSNFPSLGTGEADDEETGMLGGSRSRDAYEHLPYYPNPISDTQYQGGMGKDEIGPDFMALYKLSSLI